MHFFLTPPSFFYTLRLVLFFSLDIFDKEDTPIFF